MSKKTHKKTRATEFSDKVRKIIKERDGGCIFCEMGYHMEKAIGIDTKVFSIMHYIPRGQNGLGIEENGAVGCQYHHDMLDNGNEGRREEMLGMFREYLMQMYDGWNEEDLKYDKWDFLKK